MKEIDITTTKTIENYLSQENPEGLDMQAVRMLVDKDNSHAVEQVLRRTWNSIPTMPLLKADVLKLISIKNRILMQKQKIRRHRINIIVGSFVSASVAACIIYFFVGIPQPVESPVAKSVFASQPSVDSVRSEVSFPKAMKTETPVAHHQLDELIESDIATPFEGESLVLSHVPQLFVAAPEVTVSEPIRLPRQIVVPENSKQTIVLNDGSQIELYGGSTLTMLSSADSPERRLSLKGKADFDVQHDPNRPFIVETQSLKVQVLGTSFGVTAVPSDPIDRVSLKRGSVDIVIGDGLRYRLKPGEVLTYDRETLGLNIQ